jgi:O-antigen ligase
LLALTFALVFPLLALPRISLRAKVSIVVIAAIAGLISLSFWGSVAVNRLSSISAQVTQRDLNGRVNLWMGAFALFLEQPLFGVGAGSFSSSVYGGRVMEAAAHNTFLGVMVEHGLPGLLLLLAILVNLIRIALRGPPLERRLLIVILGVWGISALSLSAENRETTWLIWSLCLARSAIDRPARQRAAAG